MVNRNLLRQYDVSETDLSNAFTEPDWLPPEEQQFEVNKIVTGRVLNVVGDEVWIDVGYKSEGVIPVQEWYDEGLDKVVPPQPGDEVQVLLDAVEDESGAIVLSYRKAKRQKEWEDVIAKHREGDVVSGAVTRKIKGGLLVNIGVNVFLPASQVDIRRPPDIGEYIGKTIECKILKIDEARRNIVVSRRKLIEDQREEMKRKLLEEIAEGQLRTGVVKNIAEFGAFVDLGGIDGLLHITDMSWGRIANPHEVVKIDQQLEVYILHVDKDREKIALSLKHKTASPWQEVEKKYPVGSRHTGEVVNVMTYGAFVKLEPGIEGLVHISEMSWTKRINHPSEIVSIGDQIEVQVLNINKDKQEISLGIKQVQPNPWDKVAERYPPGTQIEGVVRNLTNYGAFIEIEDGIDGLLHVSDMSWVRKIGHPSEVVAKGDRVKCVVLNVDQDRKRIALGLKQMASDPWEGDIPGRYRRGEVRKGKVTKLTNFGVFVELEPGLEGLLHISELADHKIDSPEEVVKVGDEIEVKVLRVDVGERKIGLSRKKLEDGPGEEGRGAEGQPEAPRPRERELRGGTGSGTGQLFTMPESSESKGSS
jgi:small subunit ribosomal protein S1